MKIHKTEIIIEGRLVANVEVHEVHDKYFKMVLKMPNGSKKVTYISYVALEERQDWNGELQKELEKKKQA